MQSKPTKLMMKRVIIVMVVVVVLFASIGAVRLATIAVVNGEEYSKAAFEQQLYDTLITAPRGDIYDSNMNLLATSTTAWTVYITPNSINKIESETEKEAVKNKLADGLSEILGIDRQTVYSQTEKKSYYVIVKKAVDKDIADKVRTFITDNSAMKLSLYAGLDETTKRYYPNGNLASVILGFVGSDNQGLSGLESYYDEQLVGEAGRVVAAKSAQGTDMRFTYEMSEEAKKGDSLVLTIDNYIQHTVEKYLEQGVIANKALDRGCAIAMDVNTGEIKAMAIKGDFDPNSAFTLSVDDQAKVDAVSDEEEKLKLRTTLLNSQWRNKAVSDTYEPGSVFKVITASIALEENLVNENSTFTCAYGITIAGQQYHCHKRGGHGTQSMLKAMVNSCNPAFIMIGQLIGVPTFSKYFEAFGLTQKTGIDLPGESNPVYHKEKNMGVVELASSSFGQTFKITPIQMITAISAAVNGGYLVQPHLVGKILDDEGNVVKTVDTSVKRQVISEKTSEVIRRMMEAVVSQSTSKNMYVAGYKTGGKTGTSEKISETLSGDGGTKYIASYVTVAPIEDPEIAVLVMIDEPSAGQYYGSAVSAPIGAEIIGEVLKYLGYEPKYTDAELALLSVPVPDVVNDDLSTAKGKITTAKLTYKVVGNGDRVINQMPTANSSISSGGTVILYTENTTTTNSTSTVPDFTGMTIAAANTAAVNAGINIQFAGNTSDGTSVAYKQSVAGGQTVDTGTVVTVYFRDIRADHAAD